MDQSRAINALAPFLALAKSANSPRAAADLVSQATSAANTYIFAELLQQPNIQSLAGHEQYGSHYSLLQCFAWGTWETYKGTPNLPQLSDAQTLKLRLLSLLTIASEKQTTTSQPSNLSYSSLCSHLDLTSPIDLEHLITTAIYRDLLTATLNPSAQIVVVTSVSPLRDLAPGRVSSLVAELDAWRGRCDAVLADLDTELKKIHTEAERRAKREQAVEKQIKAANDVNEKGLPLATLRGGAANARTIGAKREPVGGEDGDDPMDVDTWGGGGKKRSGGGGGTSGAGGAASSGLMSKFSRGAGK